MEKENRDEHLSLKLPNGKEVDYAYLFHVLTSDEQKKLKANIILSKYSLPNLKEGHGELLDLILQELNEFSEDSKNNFLNELSDLLINDPLLGY